MNYPAIRRVEELRSLKRPEKALEELMPLLGENPDDAYLHLLMGGLLLDLNRIDEAKKALNKSLSLDPYNASAYNLLGVCFLAEEDHKNAQACYEAAMAIAPDDADYYANMSRLFLKKGQVDQTIHYAEQGLALEPDNEFCNNSLYWAYFIKGDYHKANRILKANLSLNPENVETLVMHANNLLLKEKHAEAEEAFASILSHDAENLEAIQGFKEAAAGNNSLTRWVNSKQGDRMAEIIGGGSFLLMYLYIRFTDSSYRLLWAFLLLLFLLFGWLGTMEGIGKILAYFRQRPLRAQYSPREMVMATALPLLYLFNLYLLFANAAALAGEGPFPARLFTSCIYLSLLLAGMGIKLNDLSGDSDLFEKIVSLAALVFAVLSLVFPTYWLLGLCLSLASVVAYLIYVAMPFLRARSFGQIWKSFFS